LTRSRTIFLTTGPLNMVKYKNNPSIVVTRAPLRVSFAGGGTDIDYFYEKFGGSFISSTINKYVYVTVKKHESIFEEKYRLNYADSEICNNLKQIKNDIARECIKLVNPDIPLYISTISDVPASSGLGSSSTFAVALLLALHTLKSEKVNAAQIVEEAVDIEVNVLKRPVGKQDHLASAYGGLNFYKIDKDGAISIISHSANQSKILDVFSKSFLLWTGINRDSSTVLNEQKKNKNKNFEDLLFIKNQAIELNNMFKKGINIKDFANLLNTGWFRKKKLSQKISSSKINSLFEKAINAGALGGKLCGAGGGGFIFLVTGNNEKNFLKKFGKFHILDIDYEPSGAQIILKC